MIQCWCVALPARRDITEAEGLKPLQLCGQRHPTGPEDPVRVYVLYAFAVKFLFVLVLVSAVSLEVSIVDFSKS